MAKKERQCIVCNTIYKYCPHCREYDSNEKWRMIYCSEACMDIHSIADMYKAGKIDKAEAKEILSSYDMSNYDSYTDFMKEILNDVVNTKKKSAKKAPVAEVSVEVEPVVETAPVIEEPVVEAPAEEIVNDIIFAN